jgi:hypothetical protein
VSCGGACTGAIKRHEDLRTRKSPIREATGRVLIQNKCQKIDRKVSPKITGHMTESKRNAGSGGGGIRMLNILDRPLATKGRGGGGSEVSLSAFSFLFSEMVQYYQNRVLSIADLERKYVGLVVLPMFS